MSILEREISRRRFLGAALTVGSAALVEGCELFDGQATKEQKKAYELLTSDKVEHIQNLRVQTDGKLNLRNRPLTFRGVDKSSGQIIDELTTGTIIADAIVTWGNGPAASLEKAEEDKWLAFINPNHKGEKFGPKDVVFAHSGGFGLSEDLLSAEPSELK